MQSIPLSATDSTRRLPVTSGNHGAEQLTETDRHEVLRSLNRRPIHCAYLLGLILDNGLISSLNRGTFYPYRNYLGEIQGVVLLGHAMIIETAQFASSLTPGKNWPGAFTRAAVITSAPPTTPFSSSSYPN